MRALILVALLWASVAGAATVTCGSGTLTPTAQAATGGSANSLNAKGAQSALFQAIRTAGTATVVLEVSCDGTAWAAVSSGSMTVDGTTTTAAVSVLWPTACAYRTNITACSSCSVTVLYACAGS